MRLYNLTVIQLKFYHDRIHRFFVIPAGRRSRKTLIGKRKILLEAIYNKGRYFCGAPTWQQAKDIFWKNLKKDTKLLRQKSPNESELCVTLWNGSEIQVVGLDRPERIEGQIWHGCLITEFGNLKDTAWPENIRPLLSDTNGFAIIEGVPEGRNHYYDVALDACDQALPETREKIGAFCESQRDKEWVYYSWFSSDVLPDSEIEAVKMHLDEKTFLQEYQGSFESFEGLAYYTFGKHNFEMVEYDPNSNQRISIGMDFNVNPMTASIGYIKGDTFKQFDEIYLQHSNTYEIVEEIKRKYPASLCDIYPDSTGKHESSNSTKSDLQILRNAEFIIYARSKPPYVKDRVNSMNSLIKNINGNTRYKVNPKNCPKTVNDFNKVERLSDGRLNKKQEDQGLKHMSDNIGYLVDYNWPIKNNGVIIS